ncbi:MAG: carbohydrate-binding domain-containing protein [Prevotella sp.]|nr:carbohydrate-binding domain-containing protein [Prevotella sp.]
MKRIILSLIIVCFAVAGFAQTMNIQTGQITTAVNAGQAGDMTYENAGTELTVLGKTFTVSDITRIYVDDSEVADNTVIISYDDDSAQVVIAGNIARHLTTTIEGAHVNIVQDADVVDEITYTLTGSSPNGSFTMDGDLKATVVLNGVSLTSEVGAAIDIEDGKRIDIVVADGTTNTFADYAAGLQKACFFVNGHAEFSGAGTLNLTGNAKHAYRSDEYTQLKKSFTGTINVLSSVSDGLHIEQYFEMNGGTVVISNVAGDAIDVAVTNDLTDEYNGQVFINGGTLTATSSGEDVKVLKSDGAIAITDGTLKLTATGNGSKAIGTKGTLTVSGGRVEAISLGGIYHEDQADEAKPNAVKATGVITISGGEVYSVSNNKAFNTDVASKGFVINGGSVMGIGPKTSVSATGTQTTKTYSKVNVTAGQTVTYNNVSYTVPSDYSCSNAYVLVSPGS